MPKIARENKKWFDYPDDPLGGRVEIRHLKDSEFQGIMGRHIKSKIVKNQDGSSGTELHLDQTAFNSDLAVAAVPAWEKFQDSDGKELLCTEENIRLFALEDGFITNLRSFREQLEAEVEEEKKAQTKN